MEDYLFDTSRRFRLSGQEQLCREELDAMTELAIVLQCLDERDASPTKIPSGIRGPEDVTRVRETLGLPRDEDWACLRIVEESDMTSIGPVVVHSWLIYHCWSRPLCANSAK